jgi:hypothetical protein
VVNRGDHDVKAGEHLVRIVELAFQSDVELHAVKDDHRSWSYTTVIGHVSKQIDARATSWESKELRWVGLDDVPGLSLHPAFDRAWPELRDQAERRLMIVVDAANVVGSTPDGWWRDRRGANTRLRDGIATLARTGVPAAAFDLPGDSWWPRLHLIVEGQARDLESVDGVAVHSAHRDGDSLITEVVANAAAEHPWDHIVAVTADRELRDRVHAAGAQTVGPSTLRQLIAA